MIFGIGTDLVQVRMKAWENTGLALRFFHPDELSWSLQRGSSASASLAARFAAKEAFGKALGTGLRGLTLRDIEVRRGIGTRPLLFLHGSAEAALDKLGKTKVHLSLGHEGEYAIATVLIEIEEASP